MSRLVTPEQFVTGYKVTVKVGADLVTMTKPYQLLARYADGTCLVRDLLEPQPYSRRGGLRRQPALGRARRAGSRGQRQPSR